MKEGDKVQVKDGGVVTQWTVVHVGERHPIPPEWRDLLDGNEQAPLPIAAGKGKVQA